MCVLCILVYFAPRLQYRWTYNLIFTFFCGRSHLCLTCLHCYRKLYINTINLQIQIIQPKPSKNLFLKLMLRKVVVDIGVYSQTGHWCHLSLYIVFYHFRMWLMQRYEPFYFWYIFPFLFSISFFSWESISFCFLMAFLLLSHLFLYHFLHFRCHYGFGFVKNINCRYFLFGLSVTGSMVD